jgi:Ran GTPase-activating protein (RanGAP) involved in mRNA processing and transport
MNFTDNNFNIEIICNLIKTFKLRFTKLILRGNKLSLEGAKEFANKITKSNNKMKLTHLDLRNTKLGDKGGSLLIEKLSHLRKLE